MGLLGYEAPSLKGQGRGTFASSDGLPLGSFGGQVRQVAHIRCADGALDERLVPERVALTHISPSWVT